MAGLSESLAIASASNTNTTTYAQLHPPGPGTSLMDVQLARIGAAATCSGAPTAGNTMTARFVLSDGSRILHFRDCTLTVPTTALRSGLAGSTGDYVLAVAFENGSDILDLLGATRNEGVSWWVGLPGAFATNVTALRLDAAYTQVT